jgi:DNA-directed RNA polymerase specialized sigma subunit
MASKNPDDDTSITLMMRVGQSPADRGAWDRFVERYQPMIRAWCLRWGSQATDADDVAQEVMTKLVTAMRTFRYDPDRSFRAWLKTVTQNACGVPGRVDLGGHPPRPPADPDVRVKRIWLFIS